MFRGRRVGVLLVVALLINCVTAPFSVLHAASDDNSPGVDGLDLYLGEDTLVRDHKISGRVSTMEGKPAIGVKVRLEKEIQYHADYDKTRTAWATYDTAVTDEHGEYSIPCASYRVYRVAAGGRLSAHSESVWVNDEDATLNLRVAFYTLQGILKLDNGMAVPDMNVTIRKKAPVSGSAVSLSDEERALVPYPSTGVPAETAADDGMMDDYTDNSFDPVEESRYVDDMETTMTDSEGVFTFGELPVGDYVLMVGHSGQIVEEMTLEDDDYVLLNISEDQALIEEYREGVLEDAGDVTDYGAELDLPGELLPTPTPKTAPVAIPNMSGDRLFPGQTIYTDYAYSLEDYAEIQYSRVPRVSYERYLELLDPKLDTTKNMKYLRVDEYRDVNVKAFTDLYQSMIESYCRATGRDPNESVLYGKADVIIECAKKYEIDPVFLTTQTFHESAYGTSRLASGITITDVALPGYPRNGAGKFITTPLDDPVTVYNLYGIKAYDSDPTVGGTSYAYYNGWTSPENAIRGAAAYLASNYIHGQHLQNTPFKIRFSFRENVWHQYATGPTYAEDLARYMINMAGVYTIKARFVYDIPRYRPSAPPPSEKEIEDETEA